MLKTTPLDCEIEGSLRVKRRDPWPRANASPKAMADRGPVVKTRKQIRRRVLTWFAGRWRNHQLKRAEKPHSKAGHRKMPAGPATRPKTPLAVENGVGNPAAPEMGAPNAGPGKRDWRTPIPDLSLSDRKVGQGLIVFDVCHGPPDACSLAKCAFVLSNLVCSISRLLIVPPASLASDCIAATGST